MQIMLMAQCYAPEDVSGAVLISEQATDLVKRGHQVTVVTAAPSYPLGRVFPGYRNRIYSSELLNGVRVVRTWSYLSPRKTFVRRLLNYGTYSAASFYGALLAGKPDILVSFSPPLPLGVSAWMLSRLWRVPWVLQLEDLFPDAAVAAGYLHNPSAIRFFLGMERFLYDHATHISLISEGFRQNLLAKGVPPEKISLIPVWADPDQVYPLPKENIFRKEHRLEGKFVVLYAGNLGLTSCLEDVLEAAALLKGEDGIRFVIVGEGVKKNDLQEFAQNERLSNILFLPYQPRKGFAEMLAAADLSLVTLNHSSSHASLPSKTFNIMASSRPILAVTPPDSDLAHLVQEGACGITVPPGHSQQLAEAILRLRGDTDHLDEMGCNGRMSLVTRFSRARCIDMHEQMLSKIALNHHTSSEYHLRSSH